MNRLKYQIFYIAGPMDRVQDRGVEWREDMQQFLWDELGAGVFNPVDKPISWGVEDESGRQWRRDSIKSADDLFQRGYIHEANKIYESVYEQMKDIVSSDLRGIDISHAVILHVDTDVHMCGSYGEQTHACLQRKPVIIHCKQGKRNMPDWLFGICRHEMMFGTWDEVKDYLRHVSFSDDVKHYKRWRFVNTQKVYGYER